MMGVWLVTYDNLTLDDDFHLATMMGVWLATMISQSKTNVPTYNTGFID